MRMEASESYSLPPRFVVVVVVVNALAQFFVTQIERDLEGSEERRKLTQQKADPNPGSV